MKLDHFAKYAWLALAFNLLVILWGAYVRASKSGAGCGNHWPLCNGEVIPTNPTIQTIIEFSHRASTGIAFLLVVAMLIWVLRGYAHNRLVRIGAMLSMFFMVTEAAIGAGLVLFEMVAENKSIARALWMSAHLINTFLLVGMLTLTAWAATTNENFKVRGQGSINWLFAAAIVATLILGVSGAVSALGATLFPVTSLAEGIKQDLSPTAHILENLRIFHPPIAVGVGGFLILAAFLARAWCPSEIVRRWSAILTALVLIQLGAGLINLLLHAPVWLQLVHLLLSDLVWIALLLLGFTVLAQQPAREPAIRATQTAHAN
ncbi:MAG: COX15/CtaA family protein [Blastocatellales bacterium]